MLGLTAIPQVAGALAVGVLAGYIWGHVAAGASAERKQLRATVQQMTADAKTALEIQTRMANRLSAMREENLASERKANDLEASFAARPIPTCRYSDGELRSLRQFAPRVTGPAANPRPR